jgi:peptide/nickel transport system permease protein
MSLVVFLLARATGDATALLVGETASKEAYEQARQDLGLNRPLYQQYAIFLRGAVHGDFGRSFFWRRPALEVVLDRLPATLELAAVALLVTVLIGLPLGVFAAIKKGTVWDHTANIVAVIGQSAPQFWLGLVLMWLFAVQFGLLPTSGWDGPLNFVLPAITIGYYGVVSLMRLTRSSMLDVLDREYIRMARVKGVPEGKVVWKHALKNAAIPVATFSGLLAAGLITGSVIAETVFSWPGIGRLAVEAVQQRDYPVVETVVLFMTAIYIGTNLVTDVLIGYLDPRVRTG